MGNCFSCSGHVKKYTTLLVCSAVPESCPGADFGLPAYALCIFLLTASKECSICGVHAWVQNTLACVSFPIFPFPSPWLLVDLWSVEVKATSWMAAKFPNCQWWPSCTSPIPAAEYLFPPQRDGEARRDVQHCTPLAKMMWEASGEFSWHDWTKLWVACSSADGSVASVVGLG